MESILNKNRLEAFSDGVLAIIITIMVLDLKIPHHADLAALIPLAPIFICYVLSFIYVGIYWNNHHQMLHATKKISGPVLWANLHLLFWLSLFPFVTGWMGENHYAKIPTAIYGLVLMMAGFAYWILAQTIIHANGKTSAVAQAIGKDFKGIISIAIYALAIISSFYYQWLAQVLYAIVAMMWLVPDRRFAHLFE